MRLLIAIPIAATLFISACSGAKGSSNGDPAQSSEPDLGEELPVNADRPETLNEYLDTDWFTMNPHERFSNAFKRRQQTNELVAACMLEEGFEFIAATRPDGPGIILRAADEEYAGRFGFGISTIPLDGSDIILDDEWINPNDAIVDSLSEAERTAYYYALYGSEYSGESSIEANIATLRDSVGCRAEARSRLISSELIDAVEEQFDIPSLYAKVKADPRIANIEKEWSACMAKNGYFYQNSDAMYDSLAELFRMPFERITGYNHNSMNPLENVKSSENIDQEELKALQAEERSLALSYADCSLNYHNQVNEIFREYEQAIVNEHRSLLEFIKKSRNKSRG